MEAEFKALSLLLPPANGDERVDAGLRAFSSIQARVAELEAIILDAKKALDRKAPAMSDEAFHELANALNP